jgi:hypothetical protein
LKKLRFSTGPRLVLRFKIAPLAHAPKRNIPGDNAETRRGAKDAANLAELAEKSTVRFKRR